MKPSLSLRTSACTKSRTCSCAVGPIGAGQLADLLQHNSTVEVRTQCYPFHTSSVLSPSVSPSPSCLSPRVDVRQKNFPTPCAMTDFGSAGHHFGKGWGTTNCAHAHHQHAARLFGPVLECDRGSGGHCPGGGDPIQHYIGESRTTAQWYQRGWGSAPCSCVAVQLDAGILGYEHARAHTHTHTTPHHTTPHHSEDSRYDRWACQARPKES
jgi:hypothetical protein